MNVKTTAKRIDATELHAPVISGAGATLSGGLVADTVSSRTVTVANDGGIQATSQLHLDAPEVLVEHDLSVPGTSTMNAIVAASIATPAITGVSTINGQAYPPSPTTLTNLKVPGWA